MRVVHRLYPYILVISALALIILTFSPCQTSAMSKRTLAWSIVDTPADGFNGMIMRTCGINDFAVGPDNVTLYAVNTDNSTPNSGLYKSTNAGYMWLPNISTNLAAAGALFPVWNIAVAPDDAKFIIAVTDGSGTPAGGPRMAFYSTDGGNNWLDTGLALPANEYISCLDIARYDSADRVRDIAIGTRSVTPPGQGRILTRPYGTAFSGAWVAQDPGTWTAVTSIKFSPGYNPDQTIVVISFNGGGAALHLGKHDSIGNTTQWDGIGGYAAYPVALGANSAATIIRTGIELPSDYVGTDLSLRGCFVNVFDSSVNSAVFYISPTPTRFTITPPIQLLAGQRISSIAYSGTNATGILLAGEATAYSPRALANVWQSSNAQASCAGCVTWLKSDNLKSATGGGGTGRANVLLTWSPDGFTAYCGTSSENSTAGGTGSLPGQWPFSKLIKSPSDESAFQYSKDYGFSWNQIGIINTVISRLSDVGAIEKPQDSNIVGNNTLYLASLNTSGATPDIDSVWRSTSDPLGYNWERVFTLPSSDTGTILRLAPRGTTSVMSKVVVFADSGTENITYSSNMGDTWLNVLSGMIVRDISLRDESTMYVVDDYYVRKLSLSGSAWQTVKRLATNLIAPAHTICNPIKDESGKEYVFVGTGGTTDAGIAWADFSVTIPKFTVLKELPEQGNVHVVTDDLFERHKNLYVGINDVITNTDGIIYRWTLDSSINWDPLDPPDRGFYGLCMLNSVLYGAWNTDIEPPLNSSGADRTLEARVKVPPAPQWDQLIDGLPPPGSLVEFTREPTALHISSNDYNTLWAIDDQPYKFEDKEGCLWQFVDSVAKVGPWPTSPAPGSLIGADPVTGRSQQVDFKWRPLKDIYGYDVLIAKDVNFTLPLSQQLQMTPIDDVTGAWVVTPADQEDPSCWIAPGVLEVGRSYYWRVRGSRSWSGTPIHSPWSPTLFFSVRPGFMVTSEYYGPTLLTPVDGVCSNCLPPIRFSWSPIKNANLYQFTLARDAQLADVIVQETTTTTAYELKSRLSMST
ncbi:MAG: hypothetical protein WC541_08860, partial [Dehalococcoidia bacterium]